MHAQFGLIHLFSPVLTKYLKNRATRVTHAARQLAQEFEENHQVLWSDISANFLEANSFESLQQLVEENPDVDLVLLDLNLGAQSGLDVLRAMREIDPGVLVIIITGYGTVESAVEALKMGGLLAVNKGSIDPPTFSIFEWKPEF